MMEAVQRSKGTDNGNIANKQGINRTGSDDSTWSNEKNHRSLILSLSIKWQQWSFVHRLVVIVAGLAGAAVIFAFQRKVSNVLPSSSTTTTIKTIRSSKPLPTIIVQQVPVKINNPFQCSENEMSSTINKNAKPESLYKPTKPVPVGGFPGTPLFVDGFLHRADTEGSDSVIVSSRSSKLPNGPILSTGSAMLFSTENDRYRLLWLKVELNHTAIHKDEGVESDVCVTIVPQNKQNSVSSGEEVFCTHEHYFGGDDKSVGPLIFDFGPGGFPLDPNTKLDIASVSNIFTAEPFKALDMELVKLRDAPAQPVEVPGLGMIATSLDLLALNYEALIVPIENDIVKDRIGPRSVRSPLRDRSVYPIPNSEILPLTEFKNVMSDPVTIRGLGIFRSMLTHYVSGDTLIRVLVDGKEVKRICPVPHRPNEKSAPFDAVVPLQDIVVPPGSIIRVENSLVSHITGESFFKPTPYDLAVYILYEHPDFKSDPLIPVHETQLGNGGLDLNNDGYPDYVDYDIFGTIFADLTEPNGAHDTQHGAMTNFITSRGKFDKPSTMWKWERDPETQLMNAKVTDSTENWCFYVKSRMSDKLFVFHYCDESAVPHRTLVDSKALFGDFAIGDFDGDGHLDRVRLEPHILTSMSLYFAKGDGTKYVSERLVATVQGECILEEPLARATYAPSKKRHVFGYQSRCGHGYWEVDISSLLETNG